MNSHLQIIVNTIKHFNSYIIKNIIIIIIVIDILIWDKETEKTKKNPSHHNLLHYFFSIPSVRIQQRHITSQRFYVDCVQCTCLSVPLHASSASIRQLVFSDKRKITVCMCADCSRHTHTHTCLCQSPALQLSPIYSNIHFSGSKLHFY